MQADLELVNKRMLIYHSNKRSRKKNILERNERSKSFSWLLGFTQVNQMLRLWCMVRSSSCCCRTIEKRSCWGTRSSLRLCLCLIQMESSLVTIDATWSVLISIGGGQIHLVYFTQRFTLRKSLSKSTIERTRSSSSVTCTATVASETSLCMAASQGRQR